MEATDREMRRIRFVRSRDGEQAAIDFVRRTYTAYRAALQTPYGSAYRGELIASCAVFRRVKSRGLADY